MTEPVYYQQLDDLRSVKLSRAEIINLAKRANLTPEELVEPKPSILKDTATELHIERLDGQVVRMLRCQDTKYGIIVDNVGVNDGRMTTRARLANIETGVPIPDDEPVFILRGQDKLAARAIAEYVTAVQVHASTMKPSTGVTAGDCFDRFAQFAREHPERMKLPT